MGSVLWDANNLIQKVGENLEELGHVKYDETANEHVLWLRDWRNVLVRAMAMCVEIRFRRWRKRRSAQRVPRPPACFI